MSDLLLRQAYFKLIIHAETVKWVDDRIEVFDLHLADIEKALRILLCTQHDAVLGFDIVLPQVSRAIEGTLLLQLERLDFLLCSSDWLFAKLREIDLIVLHKDIHHEALCEHINGRRVLLALDRAVLNRQHHEVRVLREQVYAQLAVFCVDED